MLHKLTSFISLTRWQGWLVMGCAAFLLAVLVWSLSDHRTDFRALPVDARKQAFVDYVCPAILQENERAASMREQVPEADREQLVALAQTYGLSVDVDEQTLRERVLMRIDRLPAELVLAQAALESGWGTSALAYDANNLFGRRCFYVDTCLEDEHGDRYRQFSDVEDAVALYYQDLNTLMPYVGMRRIRAAAGGSRPERLAEGLASYSTKGQAYVRSLQRLMKQNEALFQCTAS